MTPMEQAGYLPEREQEPKDLEQNLAKLLADKIVALKAACAASHKSSIGGSRMCICGRGNGGSAACNALYELRRLLASIGAVQNGFEADLELWKELL